MNWEFKLHEQVYDNACNQNGVVTIRKYTEEPNMEYRAYYICYWSDSGHPRHEWTGAEYLEHGHRPIKQMID